MKKIGIALLSALLVSSTLGGIATFNASAAVEDVPEALTLSNVASGKEVTFRSLTDMSVELDAYAYYPDGKGDAFSGTGVYSLSTYGNIARLTDGNATWGGYNAHSTAPGVHSWAFLDLGEEVEIDNIQVGYLASWCFTNVVIQVSNDPTFATEVTTVFACSKDAVYADDGETVVYDGGQIGCSTDTKAQTGWNGQIGVDSVASALRTYDANGVKARYVRLTNSETNNGGCCDTTVFNEIQVYAVTSGVVAPTASVASGSYESMTEVELTASQADAEIYYTLDGSYPTKNSTKYEGAIDASSWTGAVALRAIAVVDGKQSEAADYAYKITVASENKALGKEVTFRSLTDMSVVLDAYAYYPNGKGDAFEGTGVYTLSKYGDMARLTDGNATWGGYNAHSTAPGVHSWAFLDLGEEVEIDNIQVGYLASWCFTNVVIQVSNDPTFATDVTTIFACSKDAVYADDGETVVYDGGQVGCSTDTKVQTGWNGQVGVDSVASALRTYDANGVKARYVRLTNSENNNGGCSNTTVFNEIQVWSKAGENFADPEMKDTVKSVAAVESEVNVIPGTTLEGVKEKLPATVAYTTIGGATGEIALTWESADWAEMAAGTFTFTASVPAIGVDDVFDVVPVSYSVMVTVNKADTSALDALITEVEALNSATYTVKTWSPLATLVAEAKESIALVTVTEETIANYIDGITAAKAALKELATDKTELATAVATASAINKANYMSATVVGLDEALATATAVNNDTDASVEEVTAALNGLNTVLNGLVEKGDTTALAALVAKIKAANLVEENYTEMSYATLVDALEKAEKIVAATETSKTEVDAAYTALENAKNGLVAYGDTTELAALISDCEALVEADYTAGSWSALTAEIGESSALLTEKVMQDVIDGAKAELQAAKDGLVSVVALKAAIASTIDETVYTAISVQVWKDAKAEAQLVLDNSDATVEEVASAVAAIEEAEEALVEIPADDTSDDTSDVTSDDTSDTVSDNNQGSSASSGCSSTLGAASVALTLIGAAAVVVLKKKD